jgi:hypothetical protein
MQRVTPQSLGKTAARKLGGLVSDPGSHRREGGVSLAWGEAGGMGLRARGLIGSALS